MTSDDRSTSSDRLAAAELRQSHAEGGGGCA
jgi:hypothetical protein